MLCQQSLINLRVFFREDDDATPVGCRLYLAVRAPGLRRPDRSCSDQALQRRPAHRVGRGAQRLVGDDRPGRCRLIRPRDLGTPSDSNASYSTVRPIPEGVLPDVPKGFRVSRFFRAPEAPRLIRTAPNGDIFVAQSRSGRIRVLRPSGVCKLGQSSGFAAGLDRPFGMAFYPPGPNPQWVYVAEEGRVVRFPYRSGDLVARGKPQVIVPNLPAAPTICPAGTGRGTCSSPPPVRGCSSRSAPTRTSRRTRAPTSAGGP